MSEDEILDQLEESPLDARSLRRVAIEILSLHRGNQPIEALILGGVSSAEDRHNLRSEIWSILDVGTSDEAEDAKLRLCLGAISETDRLDSNMAEMLWFWASKIGSTENEIAAAFTKVLSEKL